MYRLVVGYCIVIEWYVYPIQLFSNSLCHVVVASISCVVAHVIIFFGDMSQMFYNDRYWFHKP